MKFHTAIYLIVLLLLLLFSCSGRVTPVSVTTDTNSKDSTYTNYTPRQIETFTAKASVRVVKKIECDPVTNKPRPTVVRASNKQATATAQIDSDGELTVTADCDSLKQAVTVLDKEVFRLKHVTTTRKEVIPVYRSTKFDIFCRWFFFIVLAAISGRILIKRFLPI